MKFDTVTIEVSTFITVANIDAPTGSAAVARATHYVEQQFLINTPTAKTPHPDMPEATLLAIEAAPLARGAMVTTTLNGEVEPVSVKYRILADASIETSTRPSETDIAANVRTAYSLLDEALLRNPALLTEACHRVKELLLQTELITFPPPPEEILSDYLVPDSHEQDQLDQSQAHSHEEDQDISESQSVFIQTLTSLIPDNTEKTLQIIGAIFVTATQVVQSEAHQPEPGWTIDFGEINVLHPTGKLASIGHWRRFSSPDLPYFDEPEFVDAARTLLLVSNNLPLYYLQKPELPEELSITLTF